MSEINPAELTEEEIAAAEAAAAAKAALIQAAKEKAEEEAIMKRAAEKAEERRLEAEARAEKAAKVAAEKARREVEAAMFLEIKNMKAEEDYERKRLADVIKAEKAEKRRIRQKAIDDRNNFLDSQSKRIAPEGLGEEIRNACRNCDVESIKEYVTEWDGHHVLDEEDDCGWSTIHWAVKKGCVDGALFIMSKWVSPYLMEEDQKKQWLLRLEKKDDDGQTLMMFAAIAGSTELIRFFISKGCNKNVQNNDGFSALIWAAYHGQLNTVRYLVESLAQIDSRTKGGKTALQCAIVGGEKKNKDVIEYLRYSEELRGHISA